MNEALEQFGGRFVSGDMMASLLVEKQYNLLKNDRQFQEEFVVIWITSNPFIRSLPEQLTKK